MKKPIKEATMSQKRFQTVVVGVDFSPYSKLVVKQALALAKTQRASLIFVHSVNSTALMTGEVPFDFENDLIKPMAPHSREGFFSGLGSITTKVVRQGHTPILITHS